MNLRFWWMSFLMKMKKQLQYHCLSIIQFQRSVYYIASFIASPGTYRLANCFVRGILHRFAFIRRETIMNSRGWRTQWYRYQWFPRPILLHVISAIDMVRRILPTGVLSYRAAGNVGQKLSLKWSPATIYQLTACLPRGRMGSRAIYNIWERGLMSEWC